MSGEIIDGRYASFWLCGTIELVYLFCDAGGKEQCTKKGGSVDKGYANK